MSIWLCAGSNNLEKNTSGVDQLIPQIIHQLVCIRH